MRPLIRGAQGTYPYTIDMSSYANLIVSLQNHSLHYTAPDVVKVIGTDPDLEDQLGSVWLRVTKVDAGEVHAPANILWLRAARTTIINRLGDQYRLSANPLITNIGRFCAYCEKPNPSPLAVEHMVPKDNFPLFTLSWTNFLLGCTGKGTDPDRATVAGWGGGGPPADELGYFTRCRGRYLWPDEQPAYRRLTPELQYFSNAQHLWIPVPSASSVWAGNYVTSQTYATRTITAMIRLNGAILHDRPVRVVYDGGNTYARRSKRYFGLDQRGGGGANPATSDGRQFERTEAWFAIVGLVSGAVHVPLASFAQWWRTTILQSARIIGHFSIWVRVLELTNIPDPQNNAQTLLGRFLTDCTLVNSPFPGTDVTSVP
jgi:hypothetical protein